MAKVIFKRGGWPFFRHWRAGSERASSHTVTMNAPGTIEFVLTKEAVDDDFEFDTDDPIWVCVDNGRCPKRGDNHLDIVIDRSKTTASCVTVDDLRQHVPVRLRYQLNVRRSGERVPIDPIIEH
jgi:hypothetical protein